MRSPAGWKLTSSFTVKLDPPESGVLWCEGPSVVPGPGHVLLTGPLEPDRSCRNSMVHVRESKLRASCEKTKSVHLTT